MLLNLIPFRTWKEWILRVFVFCDWVRLGVVNFTPFWDWEGLGSKACLHFFAIGRDWVLLIFLLSGTGKDWILRIFVFFSRLGKIGCC